MKRVPFVLLCAAAAGAWSAPSFAQRQTAVGPGIIPLNAAGILGGVDMTGSGTTGTLTVGVVGGPKTDIYTLNNPPAAGLIAVSTGVSSQGNIVFNSASTVYGAIGVTQPGGPFLLNISGGNTGAAVNFLGPVFATTLNVLGTGSVNFMSGSSSTTATNFAADGTISLSPNSTVIGALTTTAGANTGTLSLGGASILNGAVGGAIGLRAINVVGGSNTAGVSATITGLANAFTFSLGTNTLNVGGALTIANGAPSGVINTTLASPSVYGNIRPVGATNLGATLRINVTVPTSAFIPVGSLFNIVQTQAGTLQSGTNGSVVTVTAQDPTNPLYTFAAVPAAGTIAGLVTIRTTGIPLQAVLVPPVGPPGSPPGSPPAGPAVPPTLPVAVVVAQVILAVPPAVVIDLITPIGGLTTTAAVVDAVVQLAPSSSSLAAPQVAFQATREFQDLWMSRLDDVMCGPVARSDDAARKDDPAIVCQSPAQRGGWWIKGFGATANQPARQAFTGYNASITGAMVGFDAAIGMDTVAGIGIGGARSVIDGKGTTNTTDANSLHATAYIGHERGPWFIYGDLSLGLSEYSGERQIAYPGVSRRASASYSGQDYTAFAATGYHLAAGSFTITPLATLQYTRANLGGYTETGAGSANLMVNGQSYDFLESGLGVKVARAFAYNELRIVPDIHVKWLHELSNPSTRQTAAFAVATGSVFTTPGLRSARDTGNIGAGLTLLSCACIAKSWSVDAVYDYYQRSDRYTAHQGMLKFNSRF